MQLRQGQTVRITANTDLFMMGVTHATITSIGKKWIYLRHDRSRTKHKVDHAFAAENFMNDQGIILGSGLPQGSYVCAALPPERTPAIAV